MMIKKFVWRFFKNGELCDMDFYVDMPIFREDVFDSVEEAEASLEKYFSECAELSSAFPFWKDFEFVLLTVYSVR